MEEIKTAKRRRKKSRGFRKKKFWRRLALYFFYFSAIFLILYFLFDKKEMLKEIEKDPAIFCWKVFGTSFLFAIGCAAWMWRDPKLTGK
jgi:fucose 4-O-acetylase-like acetyltransferase